MTASNWLFALFVTATLITVDGACIPGGYPSTDAYCDQNKWRLQLHGVLMGLGWGLCLPWGAGIAMYRRFVGEAGGGKHHESKIFKSHPSFYNMHRNLQVLGYTLSICGFIVVVDALPKLWGPSVEHFHAAVPNGACKNLKAGEERPVFCTNNHTRLGLWIVILSTAQVILGIVHHVLLDRFKKSKSHGDVWVRPVIPSYIHVYLGWILILMSLFQCALGCDLYAQTYPYDGGNNARVGVYLFLAIFALVVLVNGFEQVKLWKFAGHFIPFKDGNAKFQFFPVGWFGVANRGSGSEVQLGEGNSSTHTT